MTKKSEIKYVDAMNKIQEILRKIELESEHIDVDDLISEVEEAASLIQHCKKKLFNTEAKVQKVLEKLEDKNAPES